MYEAPAPAPQAALARPDEDVVEELRQLARIGYARGLEARLKTLEAQDAALAPFCAELLGWLRGFELKRILAYLDETP